FDLFVHANPIRSKRGDVEGPRVSRGTLAHGRRLYRGLQRPPPPRRGRISRGPRGRWMGRDTAMKLRCPRCQSKIVVPDEWAGRTIRCKGCNKAFRIPRPAQTIVPTRIDTGVDLEDLASLERGMTAMDERDRAEAEKEQKAASAAVAASEPTVRT